LPRGGTGYWSSLRKYSTQCPLALPVILGKEASGSWRYTPFLTPPRGNMELCFIGLVLYVATLITNCIALIADAVLVSTSSTSITSLSRGSPVIATCVLSFHYLYLLFLTMHLYM